MKYKYVAKICQSFVIVSVVIEVYSDGRELGDWFLCYSTAMVIWLLFLFALYAKIGHGGKALLKFSSEGQYFLSQKYMEKCKQYSILQKYSPKKFHINFTVVHVTATIYCTFRNF